jgi:long-chain acyl-CoA synthetase
MQSHLAMPFYAPVVFDGANLYPAKAERMLIDHPAILDVACIGLPHKEMGEEFKGLGILHEGVAASDPAGILIWCRERLSHHKCPRTFELVEDLGRNTMVKLANASCERLTGHSVFNRYPYFKSTADT